MYIYRWQRVNPHISIMHNVQETQKNVLKQTRNRVFATSIFAIYRLYIRILVQDVDTL